MAPFRPLSILLAVPLGTLAVPWLPDLPGNTTCLPTTLTVTATVTATVMPTCEPTSPPLQCDEYGYLIQYNSLYRVDLQTGAYETVATDVTTSNNVNAIGYNVLDDYLYGIANPSRQLVRISSAGASTVVATLTPEQMGGAAGANVGDVDAGTGHFWFGSGGRTWAEVDLAPGSPTYGEVLASGAADPLGAAIADWVHVPAAGAYLWTVAQAGGTAGGALLMRFSMGTKVWEVVERYGALVPSGYGALYGINNGTLYGSNNLNGQIWAFDILGSGRAPYLASRGPASGSNDGARCVLNMLV